jgi:hypothetical protein
LTGQKDWAATLHVAPKGADLTFFDQTTEQKRLTLTSNSTNSMLILGGQTGKPTASLAAIKGNPALTLSDENGAKRAIMTATTDEGAALWFFDPKGNRQASLGYCGQEGERRMGLTLSDDADTRSAFLGLNPDKTPTIALSEANGTSALFALRSESHPDGPVISITGPEQKATATITVTKSGAGLNLTDANGQTVFQKP